MSMKTIKSGKNMKTQDSFVTTSCPNTVAPRLKTACIARLLPVLLLLLALPVAVQAQFTYTTNNGTITITRYTGSGGAVTIPDTINGLPVTSIGVNAFVYCTSLTNVTIPNSVISIGNQAFVQCISLTGVYFQGNAPSIGINVFLGDFNAIVYYLFGTTGWGTTFGFRPTVLFNPPYYNYTTNNGTITITGYTGSGGAVTIPSTIYGLPVTSIGDVAFAGASLTSVSIPNSVTSIGDGAFYSCTSLTYVPIPNSVTSIGDLSFYLCTNLTGVYFQGNAPSIGSDVFDGDNDATVYYLAGTTGWGTTFGGCPTAPYLPVPYTYTINADGTITITGYTGSVGGVTIPSTIIGLPVISIGIGAFAYCSLTNVTIPNSVTGIGGNAFYDCASLTSVTIPNSVISIGVQAFSQCTSLTSITIPNSVTNIEEMAFFHAGLTSVTIPNSITSIGYEVFCYCFSLTNVTIPNSVTSIQVNAFQTCSSLTSVTIPNSVTSIGQWAFCYCGSLRGVYFQGNAPSIGSDVFGGDNNATVYYLPGTTGWGATFGSCPTALWWLPYPLILNNGPSFGVQTNRFGFIISWATNLSVVVEACTNLANPAWFPVGTNTLTGGSSYFSDSQWTNYSARFYRLRSP